MRVCTGVCAAESERASAPSPPRAAAPLASRPPRSERSARLPGLLPRAGRAEAGRGLGLGLPGARTPGRRGAEAGRAAGRGRRAPGAGGNARGGAAGSRRRRRARGCGRAWKGVCARWTGCEGAAAGPAGRCVSEVRSEGRLGDHNFRGELAESGSLRVPGLSARSETRSPPHSPG